VPEPELPASPLLVPSVPVPVLVLVLAGSPLLVLTSTTDPVLASLLLDVGASPVGAPLLPVLVASPLLPVLPTPVAAAPETSREPSPPAQPSIHPSASAPAPRLTMPHRTRRAAPPHRCEVVATGPRTLAGRRLIMAGQPRPQPG